jgi:hypothetical protein
MAAPIDQFMICCGTHWRFTLALLLAASLCTSCSRPEDPTALPREFARHVVLISLGRVRADHLAFEGYPRNTTGHRVGAQQRAGELDHTLDVLQQQGSYFARAYVPEGSFEGGMAGWLRGSTWRDGQLVESTRSLAEVLRREGWRTVALMSGLPTDRSNALFDGFETVEHITAAHDLSARVDAAAADVGTRGLMLWIHLDLPGGATDLLREELYPYLDEILHDSDRVPVACDWLAQEARFAAGEPYTASEQRTITAHYDARLLYLHDCLRAVVWVLSARHAILPDSFLAVVGDRGCEIGRTRAYVGSLLSAREGTLRVPLLLRAPRIPTGVIRTDLVEAADLMPTALRAVNIAAPAGLLGRDLWEPRAPSRRIEGRSTDGARTLRDERYRLVLPPPAEAGDHAFHREIELYDLHAARGEGRSCATDKAAVVAGLRAFLEG